MLRKKGFTLLELIIVIIVIGILASIALPRYMRVAEKSRTAEAKSILSALRSAQIRYSAQYSNYTDTIGNLDVDVDEDGKYFSFAVVNDGSSTATRNDLETPAGYEDYMFTLGVDGELNITTPETLGHLL